MNWVGTYDDFGINSIFLSNWWNGGSTKLQERYFDDFVISTEYIGMATSPTNPTVWKTNFRDDDSGDAQSAWQLQISWNPDGTDLVWDSGIISGAGNSIDVNTTNGTFSGSLSGMTGLAADHLYALRVRQQDAASEWSDWASWMTTLQTGDEGPDSLLPGDSNGDGLVDGYDLAQWQQNYNPLGNPGATWGRGDWNDDGKIDGSDLALWQQNYSAVGFATVPEPASIVLVLLGGGVVLGTRQRRRRP